MFLEHFVRTTKGSQNILGWASAQARTLRHRLTAAAAPSGKHGRHASNTWSCLHRGKMIPVCGA
eukprot:3979552-Pyramimonas_sp.AAC.1